MRDFQDYTVEHDAFRQRVRAIRRRFSSCSSAPDGVTSFSDILVSFADISESPYA